MIINSLSWYQNNRILILFIEDDVTKKTVADNVTFQFEAEAKLRFKCKEENSRLYEKGHLIAGVLFISTQLASPAVTLYIITFQGAVNEQNRSFVGLLPYT